MTNQVDGLARFLHRIGNLKQIPRTGWLDRGVPEAEVESVADHTFRTAVIAWLASAGEPGLDRERVLKLALLHDLAETVTGDMTPYDPADLVGLDVSARRSLLEQRQMVSPERKKAKQEAERIAVLDLLSELPASFRSELDDLWRELQDRSTPEAKFVKQVDVLETWMQSREYLALDPDLPVASFQTEVDETLTFASLQRIRDSLPGIMETEKELPG